MVSPKGDHVLGVPGGDAPELHVPGTARPETQGQREIKSMSPGTPKDRTKGEGTILLGKENTRLPTGLF